jgi:molecular chaperone GrpE
MGKVEEREFPEKEQEEIAGPPGDDKEDIAGPDLHGGEKEGETPSEEQGDPVNEIRVSRELAEKLTEENEKLKDAAARTRADFFNFRQRVERERERLARTASGDAAEALIPVLDNLERALSSPSGDFDSLFKGVEMVRNQFFSVLEGLGISRIETEGKAFDPSFHEAVAIEETEDEALDGIVTGELQPGYTIAGKLLRAARVRVARVIQRGTEQ